MLVVLRACFRGEVSEFVTSIYGRGDFEAVVSVRCFVRYAVFVRCNVSLGGGVVVDAFR